MKDKLEKKEPFQYKRSMLKLVEDRLPLRLTSHHIRRHHDHPVPDFHQRHHFRHHFLVDTLSNPTIDIKRDIRKRTSNSLYRRELFGHNTRSFPTIEHVLTYQI